MSSDVPASSPLLRSVSSTIRTFEGGAQAAKKIADFGDVDGKGFSFKEFELPAGFVEKAGPALKAAMNFIDSAQPVISKLYKQGVELAAKFPPGLFPVVLGLILCFYGGTFCVTIVAVEAFMLCGYSQVREHVLALWDEWLHIRDAMQRHKQALEQEGKAKKDEKASVWLMNNAIQFFKYCRSPDQISSAITGIVAGFAGVLAVLQSEFARVIALGASLGASMEKQANHFIRPRLEAYLPAEYHKWISTIISYVCKAAGVTFAWTIQKAISAVQSGVRGGLMAARGAMLFMQAKGFLDASFDLEKTDVDEIAGIALAVFGIYSQVTAGFTVAFPMSLLLWPLQMFEAFLIAYLSK